MESEVSIIVPVYNAAVYLRACLDSVIRQTWEKWTCFLVNDGSTDDSQTIIDEYCSSDSRFVGMKKQNEGGCSKAKYFGIKHAKTDFVMIVDADDILGDVDYLEKLVKRQHETDADMVISRMCCFENELTNIVWTLPDDLVDCSKVIDGKTACLLTLPQWHIGINGNLSRKKLYASLSEGDWAYIDEVHTREILYKCKKVVFSTPIYYYRHNPTSISRKLSPYVFDWSINDALLVRFVKRHFPKNKALKNELSNRHFSRLRSDIVKYEKTKQVFMKGERQRIEMALRQSYHYTDIVEVMKRNPKWGVAVALLRWFSWFQRLVVCHYHMQNLRQSRYSSCFSI